MNKRISFSLLYMAVPMIYAGGPMDTAWFYDANNPYHAANKALQERKWKRAEDLYESLLQEKKGSEYDQKMARLNQASTAFAQDKWSEHWEVYDQLIEEQPNRLSSIAKIKSDDTIYVDTSNIGIGDIFHFLKALDGMPGKKKVAVKAFLHKALNSFAQALGTELVNPQEVKAKDCTFSTHLVSVLGLMRKRPSELQPSRVVLTAPEKKAQEVRELLADYSDKKKAVVFCGVDNRATGGAIVMGGKKLHRRHLDAAAFQKLLRAYPSLMLISGDPGNRIHFDQSNQNNMRMDEIFKDRVIELPNEDKEFAFDTSIALALIVNEHQKDVVSFLADNGPSNVYSRGLDSRVLKHTAFILPDVHDSDMRMAGNGASYHQPLSGAWVYPCDKPELQEDVIRSAYEDLK